MIENNPTKIIVHHSADASQSDQLNKINEWHKSQDFPLSSLGFFVGYHFVINHEGKLTATRKISDVGAHTKGLNYDSIGICLEGNFDEEQPTEAQKDTLGNLLLKLCTDMRLDVTDLHLHRHFRATSCPGKNIDESFIRTLYLDYKTNKLDKQIQCEA